MVAGNECVPMPRFSLTFTMLLHGSKEAKMPSFITIAICGGYIHKMTGNGCATDQAEAKSVCFRAELLINAAVAYVRAILTQSTPILTYLLTYLRHCLESLLAYMLHSVNADRCPVCLSTPTTSE